MKKLGKYEIIRELGRGAMGVVFKARDPVIGRLVALKTITAGMAGDAELLGRFYREAQAAGGLQHSNVVTIYEMGEEAGTPFIAMEYLAGESLEDIILRQVPLPLAQRLGYIMQACRGLDYAHRRGIVHRDVKPANIVVKDDGTAKVVDFGIARLVDTTKTQTGMLLGTLAYMSPQQLRGLRADERSDLWAIGVMMYELLTYRKPFSGENHAALILSILDDEPKPLEELAHGCSAELRAIVRKLLRKEDVERYQSMEELMLDLEPLWKKMQSEAVSELLVLGKQQVETGELSQARESLKQALRIDASNTQARMRLDEINTALRAMLVPVELAKHVAKARQFFQEGSIEEARGRVQEALKLDTGFAPARELLGEIERFAAVRNLETDRRREYVHARIHDMKTAIARGNLRAAAEVGRQTMLLDGTDPELTQLVEYAEQELRPGTGGPGRGRRAPAPMRAGVDKAAGRPARMARSVYAPLRPEPLPIWKRPAVWILATILVTLGAAGFGYRHFVRAPVVSSLAATSPVPAVNPEETQRALIEEAQEAADKGDYSRAQEKLSAADQIHGSLGSRIADLRKKFADEQQNAGAHEVAIKERDLWNQGASALNQNRFDQAERFFRQILELPEGGRRRSDAQRELDDIIPKRREEERLFAEAQQAARAGDSARRAKALSLLDSVIGLDGPRRAPAEQLRAQLAPKPSQPVQSASISSPATASSADQRLFAQLEEQFQRARQRGDDVALQQLRDLIPQFRAFVDAGGPLAVSARNYSDSLIPAALRDIENRGASAAANANATAQFNSAVDLFKQAAAAKDVSSLKSKVLPAFQQIAQGGGLKAADASRYVAVLIPAAIRDVTPWPAIGCPAIPAGLAPSIHTGDVVACGLLDAPKVQWVQFKWPDFPASARQAGQAIGVAMLSLTVDENGNVTDAKPRGKSDSFGFTDAALAASRQWKTNPPQAQNKHVKTEFSVDIHFTQ